MLILLFMKRIENLNLRDWSIRRRLNGTIRLKEKRSVYARSAHPRRLCSASRHPSFGWPWSYRVFDENPHWATVLFHCRRKKGDCLGCHGEAVLHRLRSRHRAQIDCGNWQGEDLRAPRRKHHHCWRWTFPFKLKYGTSQVCLVKKPADSSTLLSRTSWSVTSTSAKGCTPMSCCQVPRPFSKGSLSTWRRNGRSWPRCSDPVWIGVDLEGRVRWAWFNKSSTAVFVCSPFLRLIQSLRRWLFFFLHLLASLCTSITCVIKKNRKDQFIWRVRYEK